MGEGWGVAQSFVFYGCLTPYQLYPELHPDVFWYRLSSMAPKKYVQKSSCYSFSHMFDVKTKLNIVYENLKTKIFSRDTYYSPDALNIKYFWTLSYNHWVFLASLNYPILNFKKMICPKNVWMRHWYARFIFNNYRSFVNSLLHLVRSCMVMEFTYVKVATVKFRKTRALVIRLCLSYLVNGYQENYGYYRWEIRQLARESPCC